MNNLKKILALIVTILSLAANAFAYSTPYELASNEKSVEKVAAWIINNIRYRAESSDDWQKSEETLRLGTGDCEDIAILFYESIKNFGYDPKIYVIEYKSEGHAICVFKNREGYYQIFDTAGINEPWLDNVRQLISYSFLGLKTFYEVNPQYRY